MTTIALVAGKEAGRGEEAECQHSGGWAGRASGCC